MVKHLPTMRKTQVQSLGWEDPLEKEIPVLLLGKSHGWRSVVDYSPWGCTKSLTTEWSQFHFLCGKQLNHTKDNQSSNTRKLGYVPYRWCQYIISLEDTDSTEQTKSDLRYTGLYLMEALNFSLTCDFTNTAGYVICISPVLQNCCFLHCQMCVWGL